METFAVLTCIESPQPTALITKVRIWYQNLLCRIFTRSRKKFVVNRIDIGHKQSFYNISFPYSLEQLKMLKRKSYQKLDKSIALICQEYSINLCFLPDSVRNLFLFQSCSYIENPGRYLYCSLLPNMIDDLYNQTGFVAESIDIAIIHGNDTSLTKAFVHLLLPIVKYLTLISNGELELVDMIRNVSEDSGLSIRNTEHIGSGLKTADLIINLKNFTDSSLPTFHINKTAVTMNFGCLEKAITFWGNRQIIQGIEIEFPEFLKRTIPTTLFSYYNKIELAELILAYVTNTLNQTNHGFFEPAVMETISTRFSHDRYIIMGYVGKYSIVKKETILSVYNRILNK